MIIVDHKTLKKHINHTLTLDNNNAFNQIFLICTDDGEILAEEENHE